MTETAPIPKAGGQELCAKGEQREGSCEEQVWGHAEGQRGAQQAEERRWAAEEEGAVRQGERVESQEAAGPREKITLTSH